MGDFPYPKTNNSATRDQRFAHAIRCRLDLIEHEMSALEKQGAAHFESARACQRGAVLRLHFGLTDPISLERGIGPECFGHIAPELRTCVARQREAVA